jgi:single-strand DNA-binding protein
MSVNKAILVGRLGVDITLNETQTGSKVANTTLATDKSYTNKQGVIEKKTTWHNLVFWGKSAEYAQQYLRKGDQAYVEGEITTSKYMDKQGIQRYKTDITVGRFEKLGRKAVDDAPDEAEPVEPEQDRFTDKPLWD